LTRLTRSGTGTTPVSTSATPTPVPSYFPTTFPYRIASRHTELAPYVSYLLRLVLATRIGASPHTRHTDADEAKWVTAEPGATAANPPIRRSSRVTCPPRRWTRFSAAVLAGAVSRKITSNSCEGC